MNTKFESDAHKLINAQTMICAGRVIEVIPSLMGVIRASVKQGTLSHPQLRVLSYIAKNPGSSVSELGAALDVTTPTASAIVERLVRKDCLNRQEDPSERRRSLLTLTETGQRHLAEARSKAQLHVAELLRAESPDQLKQINESLLVLSKIIGSMNSDPAIS